MLTSTFVVTTSVSVTENSSFQDFPHLNHQTTQVTITWDLESLTMLRAK